MALPYIPQKCQLSQRKTLFMRKWESLIKHRIAAMAEVMEAMAEMMEAMAEMMAQSQ
jgi:hypothetical protein